MKIYETILEIYISHKTFCWGVSMKCDNDEKISIPLTEVVSVSPLL